MTIGKYFFDNLGCILSGFADENKPTRTIEKSGIALVNLIFFQEWIYFSSPYKILDILVVRTMAKKTIFSFKVLFTVEKYFVIRYFLKNRIYLYEQNENKLLVISILVIST